ncbi:MmgE/PrpD family protein [Mycobacterium sp. NPDC003449]
MIDLTELAGLALAAADRVQGPVRAEAVRGLLNVVGTAIGAATAAETDILAAGVRRSGAPGAVPVPGRADTFDPPSAALLTGFAAHLDDFDDTHLATVVHPGAATLGAVLGAGWPRDRTGDDLLRAFAVGAELQLRAAVAMSPSHYDAGWHITGTVGPLGAAAAAAVLLGLDAETTGRALGIASSMTLGHREGFGTMNKPLHPGKAAANGLVAATVAARGLTASPTAWGGPRGYFAVLAPQLDVAGLFDGWGDRWELLDNTYKPYPCGIVSHPAIEAAEALHENVSGRDIERVDVRCHPLVVELTGNPDPDDGLAARFSTVHGVACGVLDGVVDLGSYEDAWVRSARLVAMRSRVRLHPDPDMARAAAQVAVTLVGGGGESHTVANARGSLQAPLSDAQLDRKVIALVERSLPGRGEEIVESVRAVTAAPDARAWFSGLTAETADRKGVPA